MKKNSILIIALFSILVSIDAQKIEPVKWNFEVIKQNDSIANLNITATIEKNWHLYAMSHNNGIEIPVSFEFKKNPNYILTGKTKEPKPKIYYDPVFNDTSRYFEKKVTFIQQVLIKTELVSFKIFGELSGQACIDGKCVAIDTKMEFDVTGFENSNPTVATNIENSKSNDSITQQIDNKNQHFENNNDNLKQANDDSIIKFFLTALLCGLIGLLMPCVFPMIPMTVSYFMKSKNPKFEATIYGVSIVLIFVIIGVGLSLIFGPGFANVLSTHWIPNLLFAFIFIFFAISLFGYFEITLPSKWVNGSSKMEKRGGIIGIFFMALTLVLVSFSCTLPIAGAVALNSADGSFLKPVLGMFGFSLGIAVPFTLFAYFPEILKKMPKSGGWMNTLKVTLAFIELAFALKFINVPDQTYHWGILDREIYLAIWIVLFSMLGFYLIGKIRFPHDDETVIQKSWVRYFLSIGFFSFAVYLIPGMFGAPLKAISGWLPPVTTQDFDVNSIVRNEIEISTNFASTNQKLSEKIKYGETLELPHGIKGYFDYNQAIEIAKQKNKPVFIDFTGHGCVNCRNVEAAVWSNNKVKAMFADKFIVACLYVDDKTIHLNDNDYIKNKDGDIITMLGKKNMYIQQSIYDENSQPCYLVIDHDGSILSGPVYYERNVDKYLNFLNEGLKKFNEIHNK